MKTAPGRLWDLSRESTPWWAPSPQLSHAARVRNLSRQKRATILTEIAYSKGRVEFLVEGELGVVRRGSDKPGTLHLFDSNTTAVLLPKSDREKISRTLQYFAERRDNFSLLIDLSLFLIGEERGEGGRRKEDGKERKETGRENRFSEKWKWRRNILCRTFH